VGTVADPARRNAIGVHPGSYGIYRALAIASHELKADHRPDFTDTSPAELIGLRGRHLSALNCNRQGRLVIDRRAFC